MWKSKIYHISKWFKPPALPSFIIVELDKYIGPSCLPDIESCVALSPITKAASDSPNSLTRTQYPLMLAYGLTIHKAQGLTLLSAVIDIIGNKAARSNCSSTFVAFSRIRDITKSRILPFEFNKLKKDAKTKHLSERIKEEARLESLLPDAPDIDMDMDN